MRGLRKQNKNPSIREAEYRERKKVCREARLQIKNEPYHFWLTNDVPSYEQLKHFKKDPGTAVAMFRLMTGVQQNHLRRPENLRMTVGTQSTIDGFSFEAEHNATIRVFAV